MIQTFSAAFEKAGYLLDSPRNQWSAVKRDGSAVALTIWSDQIDKTSEPWAFDCRNDPQYDIWGGRAGNSIRRKHIEYGLEHCGGVFDIILCKAVDPQALTRKVEWARHWVERQGLINPSEFDRMTGEFKIVLVPSATASPAKVS